MNVHRIDAILCSLVLAVISTCSARGQQPGPLNAADEPAQTTVDLRVNSQLVGAADLESVVSTHEAITTNSNVEGDPTSSLMRDWIERFSADLSTLAYRFQVPLDPQAAETRQELVNQWLARLDGVDFESLDRQSQVDFVLLKNEIIFKSREWEREREEEAQLLTFLPALAALAELGVIRESVLKIEGETLAKKYESIANQLADETQRIQTTSQESRRSQRQPVALLDPILAMELSNVLKELNRRLSEAHRFYRGYDPEYTWWAEEPFKRLESEIDSLGSVVKKNLAGMDEADTNRIVGKPIGDAAIADALQHAMIPYSPQELVAIAEQEFAWCDREYKRAAQELGFGDDWRKALEYVKGLHVSPGEQPQLIRALAWEAIEFLRQRDLLTIPPLAANGWRMDMMSPEAQRVNPYFLGGPKIIVSFPTSGMSHEEKLMSLRSNNIHFCRATVHHELIPGHHLQHYMTARFRPYRQMFSTPFWVEGWALYWEMRLWDLGFANSAEDRIGMLFWRRHRCARIIFSLNFQSGKWSPDECIEYLLENVGHEPSAAAAEVRRSVMGGYGPLYQAAYMLGGLQIRSLYRELVESGQMPEKQFHDLVIQQNSIPIEMVRAAITDVPLSADYRTSWRFASSN